MSTHDNPSQPSGDDAGGRRIEGTDTLNLDA
jgi:hypothetical protein